jgi:hypothetical protein
MAIPESQLETWSHQGSVAQSSATYGTITNALEASGTPYAGRSFDVFLQGSYGNNTNIYSESDVDIVILLTSCFYHDLESLPPEQAAAFQNAHPNPAAYTLFDFKRDVFSHLNRVYSGRATARSKAVRITGEGGRRNADVLIAAEFRRYNRFMSLNDQNHDTGLCFFSDENVRIANYPKQHSQNCTAKHQTSNGRFKPMVRILKNVRSKLVEAGLLGAGEAPSYYLEGLLYNVPNEYFGGTYSEEFVRILNWLLAADRSKFVCANSQYYLLWDNSPVTWRAPLCAKFLSACCNLWNGWN